MRVFYSLFSIAVILGLLCSILGGSAASSPLLKRPYYGISPQDENYYKTSSDIIKCKDGSNKFTKTQLNDDYCDCLDGTDEPGTSACPNGKFYCLNVGHAPLTIFSSKVNDGICDCCDGSDEYDGKVNCPNTCWEAGKVARDKLKKKIATYQEGVTLRNREIEKAKLGLAKDEEELSKLKNEEKTLKGLVQQLKEHKEQIETAEEKERLQREKEEREKKEAEEKAQREKSESGEDMQENNDVQEHTSSEKKPEDSTRDNKVSVLEHASKDQDNAEDDKAAKGEHDGTSDNVEKPVNEVEQIAAEKIEQSASPKREDNSEVVLESGHDAGSELSHEVAKKMGNDASETTEELSREELGRLVASRWARENTEKESKENGAKDKVYEVHEKLPDSTNDDEDDGYAPDTDYHTERYDDHIDNDLDESYKDGDHDVSSYKSDTDDDSDLSETTGPSWLEKMQQTVRNLLKAVNLFQTPVDKSDADRVCKDYEESSAKLSKLQSRISSLTKKLEHDFGPEKEFYSFYGHCFESKQNKYLYKVCPYKEATQEEGHSSTRMGSWDKFEDSYHFMLFSNGDKCWNGPDRSLKVKLRCGLSNEVTDVDEPSRCEYVALLSTPALCLEEKLWELQHKLDLMNKEQPKQRDEL